MVDSNGKPTPGPSSSAATVAVLDPEPAAGARWLWLTQMVAGDQFYLPSHESPLTFERADRPAELAMVDMALVKVVDVDMVLTLPVSSRYRMARAVRNAAIRCLVCNDDTDTLRIHEYDLARVGQPAVFGICLTCSAATSGTVHAPDRELGDVLGR